MVSFLGIPIKLSPLIPSTGASDSFEHHLPSPHVFCFAYPHCDQYTCESETVQWRGRNMVMGGGGGGGGP